MEGPTVVHSVAVGQEPTGHFPLPDSQLYSTYLSYVGAAKEALRGQDGGSKGTHHTSLKRLA
jgi:hypothetical protein